METEAALSAHEPMSPAICLSTNPQQINISDPYSVQMHVPYVFPASIYDGWINYLDTNELNENPGRMPNFSFSISQSDAQRSLTYLVNTAAGAN